CFLRESGPCGDSLREARLHLGHVAGEPRRRVHLCELAHAATPVCNATIVPPRSLTWTSPNPDSRIRSARPSAFGNRFTEAGRYVYADPPGSTLPTSGTIRSNQSEKNGFRTPRGCVISRIARRPPGFRTRRSSR